MPDKEGERKPPRIKLKPGHPPTDQLQVRITVEHVYKPDYTGQMDHTVDPPVPLALAGDIAAMANLDVAGYYGGEFELTELIGFDVELFAEVIDESGVVWSEPIGDDDSGTGDLASVVGLADKT